MNSKSSVLSPGDVPGKLVVLGTGGTIAGRSVHPRDNVGYQAGDVPVDALLAPLRPYWRQTDVADRVEFRQVAQIDSKDMTEAVWFDLANAVQACMDDPTVQGVVITHGTDTAEETAYWLHRVVSAVKPVVITCAMRPSTALGADGPQNLLDALSLAQCPGASGVWLLAAGAVHHPVAVSKQWPYRVDAFTSGDHGASAWMEEGQVRWSWRQPTGCNRSDAGRPAIRTLTMPLPRVEVVFSHAGASGHTVSALLQSWPAVPPLAGLVVAGTGNGTIHRALVDELERASALGITVWRTTRCLGGTVVTPEGNPGPFRAVRLQPFKARIALALHLAGCGEPDT